MSSNTVSITIKATDGTSTVFKAIASSAQSMGTAVTKAGSDASAGLGKIDSAASKSSSTLSALKGAASGLAASGLVGFLSDSARAAAASEASAARLDAAFRAVGKSTDEYAQSLGKASDAAVQLGFDDEDASDAIARMTAIMGNAGDAIQSLAAAEELARARGISLQAAADLVGKAYVGQTQSLQRLGIQLDSTAHGMEAVDAIQQRFAGNAAAYAGTLQGSFDRAGVAFENFQEAVGGLEGPLAGVIGLLPGISAGFSGVSATVGAVSTSFEEGGAAATAFEAAVSPLGLAIGAAGLAAGVAGAAFLKWKADSDATASSMAQLKGAIDAAFAADAKLAAFENQAARFTQSGRFDIADQYFTDAQKAAQLNSDFADSLNSLTNSAIATDHDGIQPLADAVDMLAGQLRIHRVTVDDATAAMEGLKAGFATTGPGADKLHQALTRLDADFASGKIDAPQYVAGVKSLTDNIPATVAAFAKQEAAAKASTQALSTWGAMAEGNAKTLPDLTAKTIAAGEAFRKQGEDVIASAKQLLGYQDTVQGVTGALADVVKPGDNITDVLDRVAHAGTSVNRTFADQIDKTSQLGQSLNGAVSGMDAVLSVFQELDTIGKASTDATKIAQNVVGDPGVYAAVDDLLAKGRITLDQYNAAQQQEIGITQANAQIQDDLNVVRVNSIPLLLKQEQALQQNADALAALSQTNPELAQQTVYLMDAGNAAKVSAAYSTAYAEALGQIPPSVATQIIADAAQADPILESILEKYGLINVGADGTITVNFPQKSDLDDVVGAIDHLNNTLVHIAIAEGGDPDKLKQDLIDIGIGLSDLPPGVTVTIDTAGNATVNVPAIGQGVTGLPTDKEITIDQTGNAAPNLVQIGQSVDNLPPHKDIEVDVTGNAVQQLDSVQTLMQAIAKQPPITVTVDQQAGGASAGNALGLTPPPDVTQTTTLKANDQASGAIGAAEQAGQGFAGQTYAATLTADHGPFDAALQTAEAEGANFAGQTYSAELSAVNNAGTAVDSAEREANAFANGEYQAQLNASDNSGAVVAGAQSRAQTYANGEYQAQINASDNASSIIATAQGAAQGYATTYTATIAVNDNATSVIDAATGDALGFAGEYDATLGCVDNATPVINQVSNELDNLNGKTATTYVQTIYDNTGGPMHAGGGQLGKTVLPRMALGGTVNSRAVLVGEAGPEIALLPFGTQVVPHGASLTRMQNGGVVGGGPSAQTNVQPNPKQAQAAGQTDAVAYYKGLLDQIKQQKQTLHGEIFGNTLFTSAAAAKPGLNALHGLGQQQDDLRKKLDDAKRHAQDAGDAGKEAGDKIAKGAETATTAIDGTATATGHLAGLLAKLQNLRGLVGGGGGGGAGLDPIQQAIQSFEQQALSSLGQVQGAAQDTGQALNKDIGKGADQAAGDVSQATGQMSDSLGQLPNDAAAAGKDAGTAIGKGLSSGIEKSNVSDQINSIQGQLQSLGGETQGPKIGVNDQQATQGIQDVSQGLNQLNGQNANVGVNVNTSQWDRFVQDFHNTNGDSITVTVNEKTNKGGGGGSGSGSGSGGGSGGGVHRLGGTIRPLSALVPAAALGRMVMVGEAGPELALLPYGTQVMPHGAAQSRLRAEGAGQTQFVNYGHIHIHPHTADLYQEITAALAAQQRW